VAEAHARTGLAVKRSEITGQFGGKAATYADDLGRYYPGCHCCRSSSAHTRRPIGGNIKSAVQKEQNTAIWSRQLIDDASFGPEALKAIGGSLRCGLGRDRMVFSPCNRRALDKLPGVAQRAKENGG
jgi:hypothetical protein